MIYVDRDLSNPMRENIHTPRQALLVHAEPILAMPNRSRPSIRQFTIDGYGRRHIALELHSNSTNSVPWYRYSYCIVGDSRIAI